MAILYSPESNYAKEMRKWEAQHTSLGPPERLFVQHDYPMWMFLANSLTTCSDSILAQDENEAARLRARGYRSPQTEAFKHFEAQQREFAQLAAEREYEVKYKLSPRAIEEVRAAEADYSGHMPSMPITPIPPRRAEQE